MPTSARFQAPSTTKQSASEFRRTDLSTPTPKFPTDWHMRGQNGANAQVRREPVGDFPVFVSIYSEDPRIKQTCTNVQVLRQRSFLLDRALRSRWRLCRLRMRRTPCGCGPFVSGLSAATHAAVGLRHAPAGAVFSARPNGVPARAQRSGSRGERRSKGSERSFRRRRKRS